RRDDSRRLGAHTQDAAAAGREDLEIEVVQASSERLPGVAQRLLDSLAGELAVRAHVSVASLVGPGGPALGGGSSFRPMSLLGLGRAPAGSAAASMDPAGVASSPGTAACAPWQSPASSRTAGTSRPNR